MLLDWLPPQYDVGKRKYLLLETEDGPARTKEHDLVVFHPCYPMDLRDRDDVEAPDGEIVVAGQMRKSMTLCSPRV